MTIPYVQLEPMLSDPSNGNAVRFATISEPTVHPSLPVNNPAPIICSSSEPRPQPGNWELLLILDMLDICFCNFRVRTAGRQ